MTFRGLDISQFFVEQAHFSSESMHRIAVETRRETVSMHIITMMTLIFLPGTFIAVSYFVYFLKLVEKYLVSCADNAQSFFQSGIFQWNDSRDFAGDWLVRNDALVLFFEISVPVTALVLLIWYVAFWRARRGTQQSVPAFDQSALSELEKQADLREGTW